MTTSTNQHEAIESTAQRAGLDPHALLEKYARTAIQNPKEVFNVPDAESLRSKYREATPYPHIVIENFFKAEVAKSLSEELVGEGVEFSRTFHDDAQKGKTISTGNDVPTYLSLIAAKLSSPYFIRYLEKLTGLTRLVPDPYYNTDYGYYHIVNAGGVLGSHLDHSHHNTLGIPHVLNIVVYLTEGWDDADGGAFCLFNEDGSKVVKEVSCKFNSAAIFACNPVAYHGVRPVREGASKRRHSIYFAYYSVGSDKKASAIESFPSLHKGKENTDEGVAYGTYFILPTRSLLSLRNLPHLKARILYGVRLLLPPILLAVVDRLRSNKRSR